MTNRSVTLVIGAARGIDRAIAIGFSSTHRTLMGDRDTAWVGELATELNDAAPFVHDLADEDAVATAYTGIGWLDVLVRSAGTGRSDDIGLASRVLWREVFETNVFAVVDLTRLPLPALGAVQGIVVVINSGAGPFSNPDEGVHAGPGFALRTLADAPHEEMHGKVRVRFIHPGQADTDMQRELQTAMGNEHYNGSYYASPGSVVAAVWLTAGTPDNATVEQLSIRPSVF